MAKAEIRENYEQIKAKAIALIEVEHKLGANLTKFILEADYVLEHSTTTEGKTSNGKIISTDFGYVESFIRQVKEAINEEETEE